MVIAPIGLGLDALDRLGADVRMGYPVLADHIRDRLYVMVPTDRGHTARGPGMRVLSRAATAPSLHPARPRRSRPEAAGPAGHGWPPSGPVALTQQKGP
ncbi:hypothetical protein [Streptomyces sp. H27-C3]|uniref:hypothetical protein n=1 Tax=Streptomyces sp. H27-C3 TaxID=3046305 RepID=UPI0024BBC6D9|nr:hypothetical protein [Streptomyces sp. H27-C3]MDJ0464266.1 hypothetical protein [Streptomyces sp. H27-C3]